VTSRGRREAARAKAATRRAHLTPVPLLARESLYVGIDVGKQAHVAGFISTTLLERHTHFEGCPALAFANGREGFTALLDRIRAYVPLQQAFVLLEKTGHYHLALLGFLPEQGLSVHVMHVQRRSAGLLKSDKRDALALGNHLYNQLEKGVQLAERSQLVRQALPPTPAAIKLKALVGHRFELMHDSTRRRNKLTAIADQLFPELTTVLRDPNAPSALALRLRFPTPRDIARASQADLLGVRLGGQPRVEKLARLRELAASSIGVTGLAYQRALIFEQETLIAELELIRRHLVRIEEEVAHVLVSSREGRILRSIPGVGPLTAAAALAAIGNIGNFPTAGALKAYFGWAPNVTQSGTTLDHASITRKGNRVTKQILYMAAVAAVHEEGSPWQALFERLVPLKCVRDGRTGQWRGKRVVLGRVAGQMTRMMYAFLKADAELVARTPVGQPLPEPLLYDPAVHRAHRTGSYRPLKPQVRPPTIIRLPQSG